jgi:CheY-like chemotaxis protein
MDKSFFYIRGSKLKILFVDDNRAAREISKVYFENQGYKLDIAGSAKEAIKMINNSYFDIVITDEQMPDMTGLELAEWIYDNHPRIKVVYASVYWERAYKLGLPFIKKPLTPSKLFEHLKHEAAA